MGNLRFLFQKKHGGLIQSASCTLDLHFELAPLLSTIVAEMIFVEQKANR